MATVSTELYQRLMENRPFKLNEEESDYREADTEDRCGNCSHFFERVIDKFHTCEVVRKSDDGSIDAEYVCKFWNDGTTPKDNSSAPKPD